jgi:hypothetical protein
VFPPSSRINGHKKWSPSGNKQLDGDGKHALQIALLETLINTTEGHTTHLRIDEIWSITHDNLKSAMLVSILRVWSTMLATPSETT